MTRKSADPTIWPGTIKYRARSLRAYGIMLSIHQKAQILRRAGIAVPVQPQMTGQMENPQSARTHLHPQTWEAQVEALFARYAVERATQSLQQAAAPQQNGAAVRSPLNRTRAPKS